MEDPKQVIYVIKIKKNKSFINYKRVIRVFFFFLIILILKMGKEKFEFKMYWTHKKMLAE